MQLPREFRMSGGFGRVALPYVFVLVFFFAIMLLLGSIFAGLWGGIGIAIVATGALVGVLFAKFKKMATGTVVRFSEYGVELSDQMGFRIRLLWPDITRIGQVDTRMSGADKIGEDGGVQVGVGSIKSQGVIGWGERITPPNIPGWMRDQLAAVPRNPVDGRPEVAIPLGGIDPNWMRGAMGEWVRRYRPDLFGGQPYPQHGYPPQQGYPPPGYPR
jgi:hypothetical protein